MASELGPPARVGWGRAGYLFLWLCLGVGRFVFLAFRRGRADPLPPPPTVTNRGLQTQYPLREGLYVHAGLSQYRAVIISGSNLQITGARSGLRVLAEVGSAFLLKQSPAPGARPAWRG